MQISHINKLTVKQFMHHKFEIKKLYATWGSTIAAASSQHSTDHKHNRAVAKCLHFHSPALALEWWLG